MMREVPVLHAWKLRRSGLTWLQVAARLEATYCGRRWQPYAIRAAVVRWMDKVLEGTP